MKLFFLRLPLVFFASLLTLSFFGQKATKIDVADFNYRYVEHLVKTGVDQVRREHGLQPLINDSILYVAAKYHGHYLVQLEHLSHTQKDSILTEKPQDRANYFGAVNYYVGENILYNTYYVEIELKDGSTYDGSTYEGLAKAMVSAWVLSPGHFANIITEDYKLTGVAIALDVEKNRAYACQKFADVPYRYSFEENKIMFPYSEYVAPPLITSFSGLERKLIKNYAYAFGLSHDDTLRCNDCNPIQSLEAGISLRVDRKRFVLRVEDPSYVQSLIQDRCDGFAVEIVWIDDYMCGNPAYYTKPSRRNKQLMLNGRLLEPVYRNDLFSGYKRRRKNKEVKFLPFILGADSIPFFERFEKFKYNRYTAEYFEISLGRLPKDLHGFWNHNLVTIQDKQICQINYLNGYCGELMFEAMPTRCLPPKALIDYSFNAEKNVLNFTVPFAQGESTFSKEYLEPFVESISSLTYEVDSIAVHAFSSIEGSKEINERLQQRRAQGIADALSISKDQSVPLEVYQNTDWDGFYAEVKEHPKWKYLASKTKEEVLSEIDRIGEAELESILTKQRRGEVKLHYTVEPSDDNLKYFIQKEIKKINRRIDSLARKRERDPIDLIRFQQVYQFVYRQVVEQKLEPSFLATIELPEDYHDSHMLTKLYVLYGHIYPEAFEFNKQWQKNHLNDLTFASQACKEVEHFHPAFRFLVTKKQVDEYLKSRSGDLEDIQEQLNGLSRLGTFYSEDSLAERQIDALNFNLNMMLLNDVFATDPKSYALDALKSLMQVYNYYVKYDEMSAERALELGKLAVVFEHIQFGYNVLSQYTDQDEILTYYLPMGYQHISNEHAILWYNSVIEQSEKMDAEMWCDMFFRDCGIPFQALDHEPLRKLFCEKCSTRNDVLIELTNPTDKKEAVEE